MDNNRADSEDQSMQDMHNPPMTMSSAYPSRSSSLRSQLSVLDLINDQDFEPNAKLSTPQHPSMNVHRRASLNLEYNEVPMNQTYASHLTLQFNQHQSNWQNAHHFTPNHHSFAEHNIAPPAKPRCYSVSHGTTFHNVDHNNFSPSSLPIPVRHPQYAYETAQSHSYLGNGGAYPSSAASSAPTSPKASHFHQSPEGSPVLPKIQTLLPYHTPSGTMHPQPRPPTSPWITSPSETHLKPPTSPWITSLPDTDQQVKAEQPSVTSTTLNSRRIDYLSAEEISTLATDLLHKIAQEEYTPAMRSFTCDICNRQFNRMYNLKSHLLSHQLLRPFPCTECGAKFSRNHDLNRHLKIHNEDRPYKCDHCRKGFIRRDALKRHLIKNKCGASSTTNGSETLESVTEQ